MFDKFFARVISANQADIKTFMGYTFATLDKYSWYFWNNFYFQMKTFLEIFLQAKAMNLISLNKIKIILIYFVF